LEVSNRGSTKGKMTGEEKPLEDYDKNKTMI